MSCDSHERSFIVRFFDSFLQEQNIKWMLGLGTLILFGSSIRLIGTHWNETSAAWKHVILVAGTGLIAILARQCFWRLGLRKTGTGLMALTVLLLPVAFLAWKSVWQETAGDFLKVALSLGLLGLNFAAGWFMATGVFTHLLRGRQPTFVFCYLALAAAGAIVPQLPANWWPATTFILWGLMTAGTVKVHRHVFWLTEERRLPRIFGFFPVALLGTQFLLLFVVHLLPGIPRPWLGLGCVLATIPILSTADAAASVFQQRTGNLVRPLPLPIILPILTGLGLCLAGLGLAATGLPFPKALVPTAAIAAALMGLTARRTGQPAFVWALLICATLSYNFSYTFFQDLACMLVQRGAVAVREERLPIAFYGLTYLPLLTVLAGFAAWTKRKANELFSRPTRQYVAGLSCLLLAAAFQHPKAVFPVGVALVAMLALQIALFRTPLLLIPAVAAFLTASYGLTDFAKNVWQLSVLPDMKLVCLSVAALLLLYPGRHVDRFIASLPGAERGDDDSALNRFCQRVSLGLTLILAGCWLSAAILSPTPPELIVSQGLLLSLLAAQAVVWNSPRLAEAALVFLGAGAVIQAVKLQVPATEIIASGTAVLLATWACASILQRWTGTRIAANIFRPAAQNVSGAVLTVLLPLYYLTDLLRGTMTGEHQAAWSCLVLVVVWAFDAARRWASPLHAVLACFATLGLASCGLTDGLGVFASREWLLTTCGAVALAGVVPAVLLDRRNDYCRSSSGDSLTDETRDNSVRALATPIRIMVLGSLLGVAAISLVLFTFPARVAGGLGVTGLLCLGYGRKMAGIRQSGLIALNWQLLSLLVQVNAPSVVAALPLDPQWLIPCSLPLALTAALSTQAGRLLIRGEPHRQARDLLEAHTILLHVVAAGALVTSLGYLPEKLVPHQVVLAAFTFIILVGASFREACHSNRVSHVWWSEALAGLAILYFVIFRVIHFGNGLAPLVILGTGLMLWGMSRATCDRKPLAILTGPFSQTGMILPLAAVCLAAGRHCAGYSTALLGLNSLALFAAAAFYFWRGVEEGRKRLVVLSAGILNGAFVMLWRDLEWTDPQLFLMPLGLSILGLVELLRAEIPERMHNPLRYAGALVILVSPTFHIVGGSWLHLFTLLAAAVTVTLLSIGIRVRALMYTGVAFAIADLAAMVIRGSIDRPNLLWITGIGLGTAVLTLAALCENRREVMLQKLRMLASELETWR